MIVGSEVQRPTTTKCYSCEHEGPTPEFGPENLHVCPRCKSEDVFAQWKLRCTKCGATHVIDALFPEADVDSHPSEGLSEEEFEDFDGCPTVVKKGAISELDELCEGKDFVVVG
jgi:hypothetical protein